MNTILRTLGIDISHWEGLINWLIASQYVGFVYYKATDGIYFIDSQLGNNMDGCNEAGIAHAAYSYLEPDCSGVEQADFYLDTIEGGDYKREIADCEEPGLTAATIKAFLDRCELRTARKPAIYTSAGFWNSLSPHPGWLSQYPLIVANYRHGLNPTLPIDVTMWDIWQNTAYFWVPGCNEIADGNWFNGPLNAARSWFGNYRQVDPPTPVAGLQMQVNTDNLKVRRFPNLSADVMGYLSAGTIIDLEDINGASAWVQIKTGQYAGYWAAVQYGIYNHMDPVE